MKALDLILAYGKLPLEEQDKVGQILMSSAAMRQALAQAHKDLSAAVSQDDSEETPSNVINVPFGTSAKGPSDLVRMFLRSNPSGSVRDCKRFAATHNPEVKLASVQVMFYKLRGQAA